MGTKYENFSEFEFLPGHRVLLLSLPEYIRNFETTNAIEIRKRRFKTLEDHPQRNSVDHPQRNSIDHPVLNPDEEKNADVSEQKEESSEQFYDNIRQLLVKKINDFAAKKNLGLKITKDSIIDFRVESNSCFKCSVQCPFCVRKVPCNYNSHWVCGNLQSHLKTHFTYDEIEVESSSEIITATKIAKIANINEINKFLIE